jgi:hypothetical protein
MSWANDGALNAVLGNVYLHVLESTNILSLLKNVYFYKSIEDKLRWLSNDSRSTQQVLPHSIKQYNILVLDVSEM